MATPQDAELILKLYELRTETVMRTARQWVMTWNPASFDDILALQRDMTTVENGYWRQVLGYWDMAAAFVNHGALDADLFLDSVGEPFFLLAKFTPFFEDYERVVGVPFMRQMSQLIASHAGMQQRYQMMLAALEARLKREAID